MSIPEKPAAELSFDDLLERLEPRMKRLLSVYRIPADDAQDVLQQTLLALLYQWEKVRDPECWVLGTLKRHCLMYWRTQRRRLYSAVDNAILEWLSQPVAPEQERADLIADLESVIEKLPARCRSLLKLRFRLGYEPPEVAAKMGYRTSSIGKITTRCLAALSREMMAAGITADALQEAACGSPAPAVEPRGPSPTEPVARAARVLSRR